MWDSGVLGLPKRQNRVPPLRTPLLQARQPLPEARLRGCALSRTAVEADRGRSLHVQRDGFSGPKGGQAADGWDSGQTLDGFLIFKGSKVQKSFSQGTWWPCGQGDSTTEFPGVLIPSPRTTQGRPSCVPCSPGTPGPRAWAPTGWRAAPGLPVWHCGMPGWPHAAPRGR